MNTATSEVEIEMIVKPTSRRADVTPGNDLISTECRIKYPALEAIRNISVQALFG